MAAGDRPPARSTLAAAASAWRSASRLQPIYASHAGSTASMLLRSPIATLVCRRRSNIDPPGVWGADTVRNKAEG